jgi:hypothetical protein
LRTAIDIQEQVDGDSVAENKQQAVFRSSPFITPKSCDHFHSPVWREGMNADGDNQRQQNRNQRQPHFFAFSPSSTCVVGSWNENTPTLLLVKEKGFVRLDYLSRQYEPVRSRGRERLRPKLVVLSLA